MTSAIAKIRHDILPVLIADAPDSLIELCGVNLLERLLRILQRLGFSRATIFSKTPDAIAGELAKNSWPREKIIADLLPRARELTAKQLVEQSHSARFLVVPANIYCDARLLGGLCDKTSSAVLIDSDPPEFPRPLIRNSIGPALLTRDLLRAFSSGAPVLEQLKIKIEKREIDTVDAAEADDYIVDMRRHVRPFFFAVLPQNRRPAERIILDSAQNGTLDLPAYVHAPIETAIISILCKTNITPNQITLVGFAIGCTATAAFAFGRIGLGIVAALLFGVVDGLDGKQARVKIETTESGKWEHYVDYVIENSWWAAIAFHLWRSTQFPSAFYFLALLIASQLLADLAKRRARKATGRLLDDVAPFDRGFRLIAARRNIYVWILACGVLLDVFPRSFALICGWAAITAAVHLGRSVWVCSRANTTLSESRS